MENPILLQSAVRLPTPPPPEPFPPTSTGKRKRSPPSGPSSPHRRRSSGFVDDAQDDAQDDGAAPQGSGSRRAFTERSRPLVREKVQTKPPTEEEKQAAAKAEYEKLVNARSGGTYIPPARLRQLQAQITDKTSKEYQRMAWEALKKSINGLINKVNVSNIKFIVPELFGENLVRGRGLFCRSIMKAQAASLPFTPIYAAMAAIVNTKLPQVGELLVTRLIVQFKKAFKRNDKAVCISSTTFIAHLVNQQVVNETLVAEILLLLLKRPTDDSVEIAVGLTREVGQHLEEMSGPVALLVFDQFRNILHEQDLDKRVQYMIEVLFQVRKDKWLNNPAVKDELDLVEESDQLTHQIDLEDELQTQDTLNIFRFNEAWEEDEEAYRRIKAEILGEASGSEDEDGDDSEESSDDEEAEKEKEMEIKDQTNTDLVNLRRQIYLTIMSSIDFEECVHKIMKGIVLPVGQESELPAMIVECCAQERTYSKFYGLIGERFSKLNRLWMELFEASFTNYYNTIHRYESNRLRNIARLFGHMFSSDAIGWHALSIIHLNEDETTSSSRIFIKILFQDLSESLGMPKLRARLADETLKPSFEGIFPTDNPRNIRFSINYFTSIGMGAITEQMRELLKNMPKPAVPALPAARVQADSDSESISSYSSYTSSSGSYSRSPSPSKTRNRGNIRSRSRSRPLSRRRAQRRSNTPSASRSPPPPPRRRGRSYSYSSHSRSPSPAPRTRVPPRRNRRSPSPSSSRSPSPPARRMAQPRGRRSESPSQSAPARRAAPRRRPSYTTAQSRSRSPPPRKGAARRRSYSSSRSPSPYRPARGGNKGKVHSRSRSPPPPAKRRKNTSSPESTERRRDNDSGARRGRGRGDAGPRGGMGRKRAEDYL